MHLGTWNVQGLKNKHEIIIKDLEELKLDIVTLMKTKKKGSELETIGGFVHF
jgi:exonuclease III